jgi:2-oxo-3-hexenedioate decarboxylase
VVKVGRTKASAGSFVMSGGITAAIPVRSGDHILARYQELGSISTRFI